MVHVLGVQPAQPGFAVARIEPDLGYLEWATGKVPCPGGLIEVRVDRSELRVDSPIAFRHGGVDYPAGRHTIARTG
jgi:hypothetical protein